MSHPILLRAAMAVQLAAFVSFSARAATQLPPNFQETEVASGAQMPICLEIVPDGRFFVCEQTGSVRVIKNGALLPQPMLTLKVDSDGERGLVALTLDPNFASNGYFYVIYTNPAAGSTGAQNILSRFTASGDTADPASEVQIFKFDPFGTNTSHCDASLTIGPDGKFYIGTADNVNGFAAQSNGSMLGKMIRLNMDGSIPNDNPFIGVAPGIYQIIWALGLRNPYTMAFQPGTGRLFINDVDSTSWEEVNEGKAGANYGWPNVTGAAGNASYKDPLVTYPYGHFSLTAGCAIVGGCFYNPPAAASLPFPAQYTGSYFYMDYCDGWISRIDLNNNNAVSVFASSMPSDVVHLKVGLDGSLYYLYRVTGALRRISYVPGTPPSITQQPADQTVSSGASASFTVNAGGSAPLSFQWQRGGSDISGATAATYTLNSTALSDDGALFHCIVTNSYGSAQSNDATLHVTSRQPPSASIDAPAPGWLYTAGRPIAFVGSASDGVDGSLPPSAYTWKIELVDDGITSVKMPPTSGVTSGAWTPPDSGDPGTDFFYRISLTAVNSASLKTTVTRDVLPRVVNLHLGTAPAGLAFSFDGNLSTAALDVQGVAGFQRPMSVDAAQTLNGVTYDFAAWSDNGPASHALVTPAQDAQIIAAFSARQAPGEPLTSAPPGAPLLSGPLATPASPWLGDTVTFSADASGAAPLAWLWDFGDGAISTSSSAASHVYANAGNYTVTLLVTDANGLSNTAILSVSVRPVSPLTLTRFSAALKLKTPDHDACSLSAALNTAPFNLHQTPVTIAIGGFSRSFVVNRSGAGASNSDRMKLHFQKSKQGSALTLSFSARNADCSRVWGLSGPNPPAAGTTLQFLVTVTVGSNAYRATLSTRYSGAHNGAARLQNSKP